MTPSEIQAGFSAALQFQFARNWIEAERGYRALIAADPDEPVLLYNLGIVLKAQNRFGEAVDAFDEALSLRSDFPEASNNLGNTLVTCGELDRAISVLESCLQLHPTFADGFNSLGSAYKDRGEIHAAVRALRRAVELQPANLVFRSNLIYALHYDSEATPQSLRAEAEAWAHHCPTLPATESHSPAREGHTQNTSQYKAPSTASRRLRIGYISPYFREHCQSLFLAPLLKHHDHARFDVFCYSDDSREDRITSQLRGYAEHWRNIANRAATEIASQIRSDQIDVLIDLGLHTAQNYLPVFVLRPAPRQISWLGYPGTTGLSVIDARLTDPFLDPLGEHHEYATERPIRLPHTFWCYDPSALSLVAPPPRTPIERDEITFGCLNNFCKVNSGVLASWARVLAAVPHSRLILMAPRGSARERVLRELHVAPDRVTFVEFTRRAEYLERYREIDLCLDTYPYNGHTTSLDALWMGVPLVTRYGDKTVSRAGYSFLANLNLVDLATVSDDQFVHSAIALAHDRPRLTSLHATLRARMENSPLMNAPEFARNFEQAMVSAQ